MITKEEFLEAFEQLSDENKRKLADYMRGLLNKEKRDGRE
jgi:hypothetical protein